MTYGKNLRPPSFKQRRGENEANAIVFAYQSKVPIAHANRHAQHYMPKEWGA
jgi:hypothetical protein